MALTRQVGGAAGAPATAGGGAGGGWLKRGEAGLQTSAQEQQKQEQHDALRAQGLTRPWRFTLQVGEQADVVVLDSDLNSLPFLYEHRLQGADGKWNIFETCPKEFDNCPLCDKHRDRPSQYEMKMSLMDLRGFQPRTPGQAYVPQIRRLAGIPTALHASFFEVCQAAMKEYGTIRGMHLLLSRDSQQEAACGKLTMLSGGRMFEMMTEEEIVAEFSHPEVVDGAGTVIKAANVDLYPYDYEILFPKPSAEDLRRRYGGTAPAGSRQQIAEGWDSPGTAHPHVRQAIGQTTRTALPAPGFGTAAARTAPAQTTQVQTEQPAVVATRMRPRGAAAAEPITDPAPQRMRQRARALDPSVATVAQAAAPVASTRLVRRAAGGPRVPNALDDEIPFEFQWK